MANVDNRVQNYAGYIVGIQPGPNSALGVTVAWYDAFGPGRFTVYMNAPGYMSGSAPNGFTRSRDFTYTFLSSARQYNRPTFAAAQQAWDRYNAALGTYMDRVASYASSGTGWAPPFPQTIMDTWRSFLASYIGMWTAMRQLAQDVLTLATADTVALPTTSSASPTVSTSTKPTMVTALTPEAQAQVLGTQRITSPVALPDKGNLSVPLSSAPTNATAAIATPAGQQIVIPEVPPVTDPRTGLPMVHTPVYKNPAFYVAIGATVLLGGALYVSFRKR